MSPIYCLTPVNRWTLGWIYSLLDGHLKWLQIVISAVKEVNILIYSPLYHRQ